MSGLVNYLQIKLKIYTNKTNNMYKLPKGKKCISQGVKKFIRITINGKSAQKAGSTATLNGNADSLAQK